MISSDNDRVETGVGPDGEMLERIDVMVSFHAVKAVRRLAKHTGHTCEAVIEDAIFTAEYEAIKSIGSSGIDAYYEARDV